MSPLVSIALVAVAVLGLVLGRLPSLQAGALTLAALLLLPAPDVAGRASPVHVPPADASRPAERGYGPGPVVRYRSRAPAPGPVVVDDVAGAASEPALGPARPVAPPDSPGPDSLLAALAWAAAVGSTVAAVGRRRLLRARDALSTALFVHLVGTGHGHGPATPRCELCEREGPARRCARCVARRSARLDA